MLNSLEELPPPEDFEDALKLWTRKHPEKVLGASFAAAGAYGLVHLLVVTAQQPFKTVQDLYDELEAQNPGADPVVLALGTFGDLGFAFLNFFGAGIPKKPSEKKAAAQLEEAALFLFDPIAMSAATMTGGMVLAGQNPGEILKGIGSIIDAIIPL